MSKALAATKTKINYKQQSHYNTKIQNNEIYSQMMIGKQIPVHISNIGNKIKETLEKVIASEIEGKCIVEGYIKSKTIEIITFSSGVIRGDYVIFDVVFQCYVCSPVEGMHIKCIAKNINKAGIRAELDETPTPVIIFIARDHNYNVTGFSDVKVNDKIKVRVIGQRFELNDTTISIIAELLETSKTHAPEMLDSTIKMGNNPIIDIDLEIEQLPVEPEQTKNPSIMVEEPPPVKKSSKKSLSIKNRVLKTKKTVNLQ